MPLIDVKCCDCGETSEVFRHHSDWPKTPPCPKCDAPTEQVHLPSHERRLPPAVVVFKAPDGSFRFPGDTDGLSVQNYEKQGYERIEARGWAEVRSLERSVNKVQASEIRQRVERQLQFREEGERVRRSEAFEGLKNGFQIPETVEKEINGKMVVVRTGRMKTVRMSERGKDIMRAAMAQNNERPRERSYDGGFHVEVYANNRGNRDVSRGSDGRRRRD